MALMGFDVESFFYTCKKISPIFHNYAPCKEGELLSQKLTGRGWKEVVKLEDCAALVHHGHAKEDLWMYCSLFLEWKWQI